jgi:CBS domain containing-hemolysin-like protein
MNNANDGDRPMHVTSSAPSGNPAAGNDGEEPPSWLGNAVSSIRSFISRKRAEEAIIEAVEEIIEEPNGASGAAPAERELLTNLLNARERRVADIMTPRADIYAADESISMHKLATMMSHNGHSRMPIYRGTLDDVVGFVHIKDVTGAIVGEKPVLLKDIMRPLLFIPSSIQVTKLLLQMRQKRQHMALVIDEFGGVEGLVTIEDVVEEIVGDIHDEHDEPDHPAPLQRRADGSIIVDARMTLDDFEEHVGPTLLEHEKQDNDTLGGLVFSLAGHVPVRGEILRHSSGMTFEVVDADTRRLRRLRIHNVPQTPHEQEMASPQGQAKL